MNRDFAVTVSCRHCGSDRVYGEDCPACPIGVASAAEVQGAREDFRWRVVHEMLKRTTALLEERDRLVRLLGERDAVIEALTRSEKGNEVN